MALIPGAVREVDQIQYVDADGATQTVSTSVYAVDIAGQQVLRAYQQTWPTPRYQANAVWVDVWAGMYDETASPIDTKSDIPAIIRQAIMVQVEDFYDCTDSTEMVKRMLQPFRSYGPG